MITESSLKFLPKVELHLHLDCSLSFDVVSKLRPQISEIEYKNNFIAPEKCLNLTDFLKCASSGINLMQTESGLRAVVDDLFNQLKSENVIYTEIRFAPLLHLQEGLSAEEVVEMVTDSISSCTESSGIQAKLILCTLRHFSEEESFKTVKLVERFINKSCVVGFDLAADEAGFPIANHIKSFEYAMKKDINRTAHAGEAKGVESVWETLKNFNPQRIGHGVRSIEDSKLIDHLIENQIHLEVCPTCNIQINVFKEYHEHPIDFLYNKGVSVGINTDARSLVNISLTEEYSKLMSVFNWEMIDLYKCNQNALTHAFISEEEKKVLQRKLENGYQNYS
ncbi:MAG: adenosine deaminase [Ignavibacteriaceae bacterium]|nr:adenosine deaminase [Ignavibacteriaceae bacterium]